MSSDNSNSSSTYTKTEDVINFFVQMFSAGEYKVINAYNNEEQIDLNGVLAISISNYQHLHHGDSNDYKITINISGQFLTAQDVSQSKTYKMFDFILDTIDDTTILGGFDDLAGIVKNGGGIDSDGEVNTCNYSIDMYFCRD